MRQSWANVRLEVSHDELGDADDPDLVDSPDVAMLFERVGLPAPGALPLMRLDYQIAQKLHALSEPRSERAHDLVDLQVMLGNSKVDSEKTGYLCERLFAYRKAQEWPPCLEIAPSWEDAYAASSKGLGMITTAEEAVAWANDVIPGLSHN